LQWKINNYYVFWMCVCSLRYPQGEAHAPYCHLWPVRIYHSLIQYLINGAIFEKKNKLLNTKCVLTFSTAFVWNISISKKKWARYKKRMLVTLSAQYSCEILMKLEFSINIFEKYSNTKFHENLSTGNRVVPCEQTNGQTWRC
jgi:hypothetical protein